MAGVSQAAICGGVRKQAMQPHATAERTSRMLSRKKLASVPAQACSMVQFSQRNSELLWNMKKKMYG